MRTSDHEYVEIETTIHKKPFETQNKEFFYSKLLNNPKPHELEHILEYILKYLLLITTNKRTITAKRKKTLIE